ncbi:MAG: hypothetical protein JRH11_03820 [Deltaproteobacteria bacterium]|nr:hypothetical protein [Deltaproteobacteria bacterium]
MFGGLRQVRPGERRNTLAAALSLFAIMASHALLETARDALFLAHIDASQLPFVYIGVAAAAFAVSALQVRSPAGRAALSSWLVISGLVTAGFYFLVGTGQWVLYALYVWTAVIVTVALTQIFILLGERFTASQAKRLYSVIGTGSVLGAIAGSGLAGLLTTVITPLQLLLVGASTLVLAAVGPLTLSAENKQRPEAVDPDAQKLSPMWSAKTTLRHPYARRVALLMLLGTLTFTLVDFLFKSAASAAVPADELGFFFARVYFVLNLGSLCVQLLVVPWVIRVGGPTRALAVLPSLLLAGGVGILLGGGIVAGLALKGADATLRHSLHRTASELLYVPMSSQLRRASKTFTDIAGHRGGQAAASLMILAIAALGVDPIYIGAAIVLLAGAAVVTAMELRRHYLDVFRGTLADAAEHKRFEFPELSLATLESLLGTLNSVDDKRVQVALELFAEQGRAHLIPSLILYHPAPDVLAKALELLADSGRTDFLPLADRLLDHEYAHVRAAALRARMKLAPDEALLRRKVEVTCPVVRATALVGLTSGGFTTVAETGEYLDDVVEHGSDVAKEALARAIGYGPGLAHDDYLMKLAQSDRDDVLLSVARSMGKAPTPRFVPRLVDMLPRRLVREEARKTLVGLGETALGMLDGTLADEGEDLRVRLQIPKTIARFAPPRAARILVKQLAEVRNGAVRYRVLRALNRLVGDNPTLKFDRPPIKAALERELSTAYRFLDWRLALERDGGRNAGPTSTAHGLLVKMLRDKHENARERIFRLLGILHPHQDVQTIFRGLGSSRADVSASSQELLESFVAPNLRGAVSGLIDDIPDAQRLRSAGTLHTPTNLSYVDLLRELLDADSDSLRSLAVYHIAELRLSELKPTVEALEPKPDTLLATVVRNAVSVLAVEPEAAP